MEFTDLNILDVGNTIQLGGAIYIDGSKAYLCYFPADAPSDEEPLAVENLLMDKDEWKQFLRQTDILEAEVLAKADDGKITKAILRKSARQIEQGVHWSVYRRDGYACRYCGKDDIPLSVDHLVLWEKGGPSTVENLVAACRKCNKTRGNTEYADWLNHPHYKRMCKNLTDHIRGLNIAVLDTLAAIPLRIHRRSR